jgi:hypothetical protein
MSENRPILTVNIFLINKETMEKVNISEICLSFTKMEVLTYDGPPLTYWMSA